jgi:predicted esterase YcpF (UPF0227 family)
MPKSIIYIGGYNSSGSKANYYKENFNGSTIAFTPNYDQENPSDILRSIESAIETEISKGNQVEIIGSSTGGMTALMLFNKFNLPMFLINPLLGREQFFDKSRSGPLGSHLDEISNILKNQDYTNNKIVIFLGIKDELLDPNFTRNFAIEKNIELIEFDDDHQGVKSLEMILNRL